MGMAISSVEFVVDGTSEFVMPNIARNQAPWPQKSRFFKTNAIFQNYIYINLNVIVLKNHNTFEFY